MPATADVARTRGATVTVSLAAFALGALLFWPLRNAHFYLDDFLFLALARHVDDPLALLLGDSTGLFFFRPLGMFLWWPTVAAFGGCAPCQAALNMALHAMNGVLLYGAQRKLRLAPWPAVIVATLFVAHPSMFAAAAWMSDRFDLLAAGFGLASLLAAIGLRERFGFGRLVLVAALLAAAMGSKETGYAAVPACAVLLCQRSPDGTRMGKHDLAIAIGTIAACAFAMLAWRFVVLRGAADVMFLREGLVPTMVGGAIRWLSFLPAFFAVRFGHAWAAAAWVGGVAAFMAAIALPAVRLALCQRAARQALAVGATLAFFAVLAQAPVVKAAPIATFGGDALDFEALVSGRFFYIPFVGMALALGALAHSIGAATRSRALRAGVAIIALAMLAGEFAASRAIGRAWAAFPLANGEPELRLMTQVVHARTNAPPACKIYFLGVPARAQRTLALLDVAVKSSLPEGHPAMGCFISSEHTPWYHLVARAGQPPRSYAPLTPMTLAGKAFASITVANLEYHYLNAADPAAMVRDPSASFYLYRDGGFVDATADVRAGRLVPAFYVNRQAL